MAVKAVERGVEDYGPAENRRHLPFARFNVPIPQLERATEFLEEDLALELTHGYLKPIEVDTDVGLIAVVGEGMRGTPGLAGRIFTAISRRDVNIIAIAQGSNELTIAIVVRRAGLEQAVRAVHGEF